MLKRLRLKLLSSVFVAAMLMACASSNRTDHQRSPIDLPERELSSEALLHQADLAEVRHDYATAGTHYRHYLQKFPGDPYETEVLTKLGKVYERLEDQTAALNAYRKVETEHSHSPWATEAMLNAARIYLRSDDIPEALARANQVIAKEDTSDEQKRQGYLLRGNIYARQQTPHSALTDFLRVYELTDARLLPNLEQQIQSHIDNIDTETLTAVQQETPESAAHNWLTYLIGVRLMEQEKYQAAFEHLSAAVSADPESPHANDARGRIEQLNQLLTPDTTIIGCLLPLSGPYQAVGESALAGIELALHTLGRQHTNHRFSITVADTAGDDTKALAALERLGRKKIAAIIGPIVTAKAVAQRANEMAIPLLTLNQSDGIPQIGPFIFRNFITPQMQVQALVDHAVMNRGIDRLAILYPYEKYGRYYSELFRTEVEALGGQIIAEVFYTTRQYRF